MSKVTTADCRIALLNAWRPEFGDNNGNWKRVGKIGKKGEPIARVFYHRALPLQAHVWEKSGAISSVELSGLAMWHLQHGTPLYEEFCNVVESNESNNFLRKHDLFKPGDFLFHALSDSDADDWTNYMVTPIAYWKRERHAYCNHLELAIGRHLPEGHHEAQEAIFSAQDTPEGVAAKLLARGFVEDADFSDFIERCHSGVNGYSDDDDDE